MIRTVPWWSSRDGYSVGRRNAFAFDCHPAGETPMKQFAFATIRYAVPAAPSFVSTDPMANFYEPASFPQYRSDSDFRNVAVASHSIRRDAVRRGQSCTPIALRKAIV